MVRTVQFSFRQARYVHSIATQCISFSLPEENGQSCDRDERNNKIKIFTEYRNSINVVQNKKDKKFIRSRAQFYLKGNSTDIIKKTLDEEEEKDYFCVCCEDTVIIKHLGRQQTNLLALSYNIFIIFLTSS